VSCKNNPKMIIGKKDGPKRIQPWLSNAYQGTSKVLSTTVPICFFATNYAKDKMRCLTYLSQCILWALQTISVTKCLQNQSPSSQYITIIIIINIIIIVQGYSWHGRNATLCWTCFFMFFHDLCPMFNTSFSPFRWLLRVWHEYVSTSSNRISSIGF